MSTANGHGRFGPYHDPLMAMPDAYRDAIVETPEQRAAREHETEECLKLATQDMEREIRRFERRHPGYIWPVAPINLGVYRQRRPSFFALLWHRLTGRVPKPRYELVPVGEILWRQWVKEVTGKVTMGEDL